jgi:hypothetical protein
VNRPAQWSLDWIDTDAGQIPWPLGIDPTARRDGGPGEEEAHTQFHLPPPSMTEVRSNDRAPRLSLRNLSQLFPCRTGAVSAFFQASLDALLCWGEWLRRWGRYGFPETLPESMDKPRYLLHNSAEHLFSCLLLYQGI